MFKWSFPRKMLKIMPQDMLPVVLIIYLNYTYLLFFKVYSISTNNKVNRVLYCKISWMCTKWVREINFHLKKTSLDPFSKHPKEWFFWINLFLLSWMSFSSPSPYSPLHLYSVNWAQGPGCYCFKFKLTQFFWKPFGIRTIYKCRWWLLSKGLHFWDMKTFFPALYEFRLKFYWMEERTDEYWGKKLFHSLK